eukprot:scaffold67_cov180-Ochromonas_danica.AAC.2
MITGRRELNEQVEIGTIDYPASDEVGDFVIALSRGVALTAEDVVIVRSSHDGRAHKHLRDLQQGDDPRGEPLGDLLESLETVVEVHDGVHGVVHGDEVESCARHGHIGVPAEDQHGDVVVPVQEDQRLLAQDNEDGVDQLGDLGPDEEQRGQTASAGAIGSVGSLADGLLEGHRGQAVQDMRNSADSAV